MTLPPFSCACPEKGLAPAVGDRADYYRWLFFAAGPVEQAITNCQLGWTPTAEQKKGVGYGCYDDVINTLEQAVKEKRFIASHAFSAVDIYTGGQIDWGLRFGTVPQRPAFVDYITRLRERPAYKKAQEIDSALVAAM
ncbi:MAG: hypothetical protein E2598_03035 [Sphingobium sp.]|nr:hypothetical protein [Sphingobium sp.]